MLLIHFWGRGMFLKLVVVLWRGWVGHWTCGRMAKMCVLRFIAPSLLIEPPLDMDQLYRMSEVLKSEGRHLFVRSVSCLVVPNRTSLGTGFPKRVPSKSHKRRSFSVCAHSRSGSGQH